MNLRTWTENTSYHPATTWNRVSTKQMEPGNQGLVTDNGWVLTQLDLKGILNCNIQLNNQLVPFSQEAGLGGGF